MLKLIDIFSFRLLSTTKLGLHVEEVYVINSEQMRAIIIRALMMVTVEVVSEFFLVHDRNTKRITRCTSGCLDAKVIQCFRITIKLS
jgi:hypothetical protein